MAHNNQRQCFEVFVFHVENETKVAGFFTFHLLFTTRNFFFFVSDMTYKKKKSYLLYLCTSYIFPSAGDEAAVGGGDERRGHHSGDPHTVVQGLREHGRERGPRWRRSEPVFA